MSVPARFFAVEGAEPWDFSGAFVDLLWLSVPNIGQFRPINGGDWQRYDSQRDDLRSGFLWREFEGSYETTARLRCGEEVLEGRFNPSRMNRPDNVFGVSLSEALRIFREMQESFGLPPSLDGAEVVAIDCTKNFSCGSYGALASFLRMLRGQTLSRFRTVPYGSGEAVYFHQKGRVIKFYDKAAELRRHNRSGSSEVERLAAYCEEAGVLRVELHCAHRWLRDNGLRPLAAWSREALMRVLRESVGEIPTGVAEVDLSSLTFHELGILRAWQAGDAVRAMLSRSAFYRFRKSIKAKCGFDIGAEGPLQFRPKVEVVSLFPAVPPDWYLMPDGRPYALHKADAEARAAGQLFLLPKED